MSNRAVLIDLFVVFKNVITPHKNICLTIIEVSAEKQSETAFVKLQLTQLWGSRSKTTLKPLASSAKAIKISALSIREKLWHISPNAFPLNWLFSLISFREIPAPDRASDFAQPPRTQSHVPLPGPTTLRLCVLSCGVVDLWNYSFSYNQEALAKAHTSIARRDLKYFHIFPFELFCFVREETTKRPRRNLYNCISKKIKKRKEKQLESEANPRIRWSLWYDDSRSFECVICCSDYSHRRDNGGTK